jgi:hydrogenase-4 component B
MILVAGAISALLGVLYALTEHDIKRLLAYHSIENIGIILLGFGSGLVFLSLDMRSYAFLGFGAALFHTLNHAIFKALLFLGAGSVISKTHTRNMEEYGGLAKYMPYTAFFFLVGSLAISALPPFNGFFSEWMTFQSLFAGIRSLDTSLQWVFIAAAGSLAFTGGLAAACFVKAFGVTFLARPRSEEVCHANESPFSMRFGMGTLALLTLVIGVFSGVVSRTLSSVVQSLNGFETGIPSYVANARFIQVDSGFANISAPLIFITLGIVTCVVYILVHAITVRRKEVISRTWDCGIDLGPRMEITATGFSRSLIVIFKGLLRPSVQTEIEYHDSAMRYFPKSQSIIFETADLYRTYLYEPIAEFTMKVTDRVKYVQGGNLNVYVLYTFVVLVSLLIFLGV